MPTTPVIALPFKSFAVPAKRTRRGTLVEVAVCAWIAGLVVNSRTTAQSAATRARTELDDLLIRHLKLKCEVLGGAAYGVARVLSSPQQLVIRLNSVEGAETVS